MATDGVRLPTVSTTVTRGTNATNSNTNIPNEGQPGLTTEKGRR